MSNDVRVRIDNRLLHYVPFSVTYRREKDMDVEKEFKWGRIRMVCLETVNMQDADVLFALVYQAGMAEQNHGLEHNNSLNGSAVVGVRTGLRAIARLAGSTRLDVVEKSIVRLAAYRIEFITGKGEPESIQTLRAVEHCEIDRPTKEIHYLLDKEFFELCKDKGLRVNLTKFTAFRKNTTKALYLFLVGNSGGDRFLEDTLLSRIGIGGKRPNKRRQQLQKAFDDLKEKHIIKDWSAPETRSDQFYEIIRFR